MMLLMIAIAVSSVAFGQAKMSKDSKVESQIIALEKKSWEAWKNKDTKWFQDTMADDSLHIDATGEMNKMQFIKAIPDCDAKSISLDNFKFLMLDKNSAMITFVGTYEGWYAPIYFSEEDTNPAKNLPRSMFGGIALTAFIYLLVNLALFYMLPTAQLANSKFAGADAMSLIFGANSGRILTVLALLSFLGTINALLMQTSRTLFGLGREGLFIKKAAVVNSGGTPVYALLISSLFAIVFTVPVRSSY